MLRSLEQFNLAAEVISLFVPKDQALFRLDGAGMAEDFRSLTAPETVEHPLIVLIGPDSMGAPEVIADTLRMLKRAVIVGSRSGGRAAAFREVHLSEGKLLRVANRKAARADGTSLYPGNVEPDVAVASDWVRDRSLLEMSTNFEALVVEEESSMRASEAALVRGENPEIDALRERSQSKAPVEPPETKDRTLQTGIDILRAIDALKLNRASAAPRTAAVPEPTDAGGGPDPGDRRD